MNKAFTFRLNPTEEQQVLIKQHAGAVRWLWNNMLAANIEKYDLEKKFNFQFDMNRLTTDLRKEHEWLKEINSQSLQQKNKDLDAALKRKISKKSSCGFPKFKKKSNNNDSFRVPQFFRLSNKAVYLPKIGWIKWKVNRKLIGKVKSITIKQDLNNWIAVVLVEIPDVVQRTDFHINEIVGIDVGIKDFAILSDGTKIDNPKQFHKSEKLLKRKQKQLSKKVKGSNKRKVAKYKVAKLHRQIKNKRKDFQWKLVNSITKKYQVVCMEDLNIKGMVKNRKLSKAISSVGWGMFKTKLSQSLASSGGLLIDIPRFYPSSKTCSSCGTINEGLTLSDRKWVCLACDSVHDRDVNAALNIKEIGLKNSVGTTRIYGYGDTSSGIEAIDSISQVSLKYQNLVIGPDTTGLNIQW
jgi:putative transposase